MDWTGKKCVVTGGSGFLGSHLVSYLREHHALVTTIDILPNADIVHDISLSIPPITEADYIFHLAAIAHPPTCVKNPRKAIEVNVNGTVNMLELAAKIGVKKFLFPSTAQVYGDPQYFPIDEKHPVPFTTNIYVGTKKVGEELCLFYSKFKDVPTVFFRLFNIYGPHQTNDYLIPTIFNQALDSSKTISIWSRKPTRSFMYVDDAVNAFILAAESSFVGGPLNIGTNDEFSVGEIADLIASWTNAKVVDEKKEVIGSSRLACNASLAKEKIGWEAKVSFLDGLCKTFSTFK